MDAHATTPSPATLPSAHPLRRALLANAAFSTLCGVVLLLAPVAVTNWLGIGSPLLLALLGGSLLFFAAALTWEGKRPRPAAWRTLLITAADILWVVGSLVVMVLFADDLKPAGNLLIATVAFVVALFAGFQVYGIDACFRVPGTRRYRHCIPVLVDAPPADLWAAIGQLGEIHRYAPMISASTLQPGPATVGAVRTCSDLHGNSWSERCTRYEEGRALDLEFRADEPGFPFPATAMRGGWTVAPSGQTGSLVTVWWELTPRPVWLSPVIMALLARQTDRDFPAVIANMATSNPETQHAAASRRLAFRLPQFC